MRNVMLKSLYGLIIYWVQGREIFKDPVTDDGTKKSAKGLLTVMNFSSTSIPTYHLQDQVHWEAEEQGALQTIYYEGSLENLTTLTEIRGRIKNLINA